VRCRTSGASIPDLIKVVTDSTYNLLLAERVSVYLVDRIKGEIWICVSKDKGVAGLTLPIGKGISGQVAKDGKTINLKDCYSDDRFDSTCDRKTGFVTRSMLCMAVPGFDDDTKPVAVIQAINKIGAKSFDDEDEESLSAFCDEVKMAMRGNFLEAQLLKLESDSHRRSDLESSLYLREFGAMFGRDTGEPPTNMAGSSTVEPPSPVHKDSFDSPGGSPTNKSRNWGRRMSDVRREDMAVLWRVDSPNLEARLADASTGYLGKNDFDSFSYDVFSFDHAELCAVVFQFFKEFGLIKRLSLDETKLQNLILAIHATYNDVPFHNFYHAFSVCHVSYMIMRHCGAAQCLTSLDIFACLIAALSHDCDHRGVSNQFLIEVSDSLAVEFSDDAVLERHHSRTASTVFAEPDNNVFEPMQKADRKSARRTIIEAILGTDMSRHTEHVTHLHERAEKAILADKKLAFDRNNTADRVALVKHIVHCADLSAQTLPPVVSEAFEQRVIDEFTAQVAKERQLNVEETSFMRGLQDKKKRCELQLNFVGAVVLPLWRGMSKCFPECQARVDRADEIRSEYAAFLKLQ
jgi:putative methionine-R-sulfoxide reductase with GAF domain